MVGSSQIDHDVASCTFLHIIPISSNAVPGALNINKSDNSIRKVDNANVDEIGLTMAQRIARLKSYYTKIVYVWASD